MVRQIGIEPTTHGLEGRCSIPWATGTLLIMERVKGIEPSQPAWKAGALPLSYTRKSLLSIWQFAVFVNNYEKKKEKTLSFALSLEISPSIKRLPVQWTFFRLKDLFYRWHYNKNDNLSVYSSISSTV